MMLQVFPLLSDLICALCEGISANLGTNDLVALDIASVYHSYMFEISKSCHRKVCLQ